MRIPIGCGVCVSGCDKARALSIAKRASYVHPHENAARLAADIGLQSIGLRRLLDERFPGVYQRLKTTVGNRIRWTGVES